MRFSVRMSRPPDTAMPLNVGETSSTATSRSTGVSRGSASSASPNNTSAALSPRQYLSTTPSPLLLDVLASEWMSAEEMNLPLPPATPPVDECVDDSDDDVT
jgi:hypothetical protein